MRSIEEALQQRSSESRIVELDSLRGLAACVVIFCHLRAPFTVASPRWFLTPVFNGHVSVILFFVLSGYVLSLPFWRGRQWAYPQYLIRRFFRLYVPYGFAVCFALLVGGRLIGSRLPLTSWFYVTWHSPLTLRLLGSQFLTIDTSGKINIAFWSLRYEMEMSRLMPFICACLRSLSVKTALLLAFAIEVIGYAGIHLFKDGWGWLEVSKTVAFGSCFVLGAILAKERAAVARIYSTQSLFPRELHLRRPALSCSISRTTNYRYPEPVAL